MLSLLLLLLLQRCILLLLILLLTTPNLVDSFQVTRPSVSSIQSQRHASTSSKSIPDDINNKDDVLRLMELSSAHVIPQALRVFVECNIADILHSDPHGTMTVSDILQHMTVADGRPATTSTKQNEDTIERILRLLAQVGVVQEEFISTAKTSNANSSCSSSCFAYQLTSMGQLLVSTSTSTSSSPPTSTSWSSMVLHWTEPPLWNSWSHLSTTTTDTESADNTTTTPFELANNGVSSDYFYNKQHAPQSLQHANEFVNNIHRQELHALVHDYDWSWLKSDQVLMDVGGYNAKVLKEIQKAYHPNIANSICFDLPEVVQQQQDSPGIQFIAGDIMDPSTLPEASCDAILLKHILDKSMWTNEESVQVLRSCAVALKERGKILIAETILPSSQEQPHSLFSLAMNVQFLLVGRQSGRTIDEWKRLIHQAGPSFKLESIHYTSSPSCSVMEVSCGSAASTSITANNLSK